MFSVYGARGSTVPFVNQVSGMTNAPQSGRPQDLSGFICTTTSPAHGASPAVGLRARDSCAGVEWSAQWLSSSLLTGGVFSLSGGWPSLPPFALMERPICRQKALLPFGTTSVSSLRISAPPGTMVIRGFVLVKVETALPLISPLRTTTVLPTSCLSGNIGLPILQG